MDQKARPNIKRFAGFAGSSLTATAVDQLCAWFLFWALEAVLPGFDLLRIFLGTLFARIASVALNYRLNSKRIFKTNNHRQTLPRFLLLAAVILSLSTLGVFELHTRFDLDEKIAKLIVDFGLFFVNYTMQKRWVFVERPRKAQRNRD